MRVPTRRYAAGFTYVGLIVLVTIIGLVGAATLRADALLRRAAAEQALLETGASFIAALDSYAAVTPAGQSPQPATLRDLLADPRFSVVRRHLRKIPIDPVTGKPEWGVIYARGNAGVIGVHSLSDARPFKRANFEPRFSDFDNAERLSDWIFVASAARRMQPAKRKAER